MSLSRQVLSSPFDVEQRPRETSTQNGGNRIKVKENGSTLVARNSTTEDSACSVNQQPESISFDSRSIKNDIYANPIVTVKGQPKDESKSRDTKKRNDSTPPPVKGRVHISIQTDEYDTDVVADNCFQEKLSNSCAQNDLHCSSMEKLSIDAPTEVVVSKEEDTATPKGDINSCNDEPQKKMCRLEEVE